MKAEDVERLKLKKPFSVSDIIVYAILTLFIFSLFLVFVILPKNVTSDGFKVTINDNQAFIYEYETGKLTIDGNFHDCVFYDETSCTITVYHTVDKTSFNVIAFDRQNKKVWMKESTCSHTKDCVYSPAIESDAGMIYCAPHQLKISPISSSGVIPPVIG
jgi:hypothetical protein